jgi:Mn-dependent DtxR family transcriptional regulator
MTIPFTAKQGQYLAYIATYLKLHRRAPAESDMQAFFGVTPPSVHRMVVELERLKLIRRQPGVPRSIELLVPPNAIPDLE